MKKTIITLITGVLIGTISSVLASTYIASQITYTPKDKTWKVDSVGAAIDSLYLSKTADNYSTEETNVGTWIDGKPLYQKIISFTTGSKTDAWLNVDHNIANVDNIFIKIGFINNVNGDMETEPSSSMQLAINKTNISYVLLNSTYQSKKIYIIIQYTKTTDQVS